MFFLINKLLLLFFYETNNNFCEFFSWDLLKASNLYFTKLIKILIFQKKFYFVILLYYEIIKFSFELNYTSNYNFSKVQVSNFLGKYSSNIVATNV